MTHLLQPQTHHKVIVPWYDSKRVIVFSILGLMIILAFGVVGIIVAQENDQYESFWVMPFCIVLMSGYVIVSMAVRVIIRRSRGSE